MERKQIIRTVKLLDDAIEGLVIFNTKHTVPEGIFDNIATAIALLENDLQIADDEYAPVDLDRHKSLIDPYEEDY